MLRINAHTSATVHFATASGLSFLLPSDVVAASFGTFVCCFCELPLDVGSFRMVCSPDCNADCSSVDLLAALAQAGEQYFFFFDDFESSFRQLSQDDDGFSTASMA